MTLKFTGDNVMLASVNATTQAGGAVGLVDGNRDKANIVDISGNLVINGEIGSNTTTFAGGVIGYISSQVPVNTAGKVSSVAIVNVVNCNSVTGKTAGGIVGYSEAKWVTFTILNCINLGNVSATGAGAAGGIFGQHGVGKGTSFLIDGCVNAGNVSAAQHRAAGIAAHLGTGNLTYTDANDTEKTLKSSITISNCINFGAIKNTMTEEDLLKIQEVTDNPAALGQAYTISCMLSSGTSKITNCANFGSRNGWKKTVSNGTDENGKTTYTVTAAVRDTAAAMYTSSGALTGCVDFADAENTTTSVALDSALLDVLSGAVVRFNKNDIKDNGLRYYIQTNEALLDKLAKTYTISLGSNFALATEGLTTLKDVNADKRTEVSKSYAAMLAEKNLKDDDTYAAALNKFAPEQYAKEFVAGGFITLTVDEKTFTIYTLAGDARSMAYVANETLKNDTAGKYNDYETILETFAAALPAEN